MVELPSFQHPPPLSILFQRVRELCGGTVISDVLNYARTVETFQNKLEPAEWQYSESVLGFGGTQFGGLNVASLANPIAPHSDIHNLVGLNLGATSLASNGF